jgi:hypothetical protein
MPLPFPCPTRKKPPIASTPSPPATSASPSFSLGEQPSSESVLPPAAAMAPCRPAARPCGACPALWPGSLYPSTSRRGSAQARHAARWPVPASPPGHQRAARRPAAWHAASARPASARPALGQCGQPARAPRAPVARSAVVESPPPFVGVAQPFHAVRSALALRSDTVCLCSPFAVCPRLTIAAIVLGCSQASTKDRRRAIHVRT